MDRGVLVRRNIDKCSMLFQVNNIKYLDGGNDAMIMSIFTIFVYSNPAEVIKTRMQLQGELKQKGTYHK